MAAANEIGVDSGVAVVVVFNQDWTILSHQKMNSAKGFSQWTTFFSFTPNWFWRARFNVNSSFTGSKPGTEFYDITSEQIPPVKRFLQESRSL